MKIFNILKNIATKVVSAFINASDAIAKLKTAGIGYRANNICDTDNMLLLADKYNGAFQWVYTSDATTLTNAPNAWASGSVVAYRQVMMYYTQTLNHAVVVLWEVHPVAGRVWVNIYNTTWRGWHSVNFTSFGNLAETDLNNENLRKRGNGAYWVNPNTTTTNMPTSAFGILEVIQGNPNYAGSQIQRFTVHNSNVTYQRTFTNAQWYAWKQIT